MERNNVGWFEIYVKDMERAKTFYETVFNVTLEKLDMEAEGIEMWMFPGNPEKPGAPGALVKMKGLEPSGVSSIVYFTSNDCAIEEKRVEEAGGNIHEPKKSVGQYGFISMAVDTEGNMLGIHSEK